MGNFKDMLKYLRSREKMSQAELADKLGISKSTVGMYELGKREPDFETLENIADLFNVDMNFLLGKPGSELPMPIIMSYYSQLNDLGQETATEQVRLLTLDKKYIKERQQITPFLKEADIEYTSLKAAHERTDQAFTSEDRQKDIEMIRKMRGKK